MNEFVYILFFHEIFISPYCYIFIPNKTIIHHIFLSSQRTYNKKMKKKSETKDIDAIVIKLQTNQILATFATLTTKLFAKLNMTSETQHASRHFESLLRIHTTSPILTSLVAYSTSTRSVRQDDECASHYEFDLKAFFLD